MRCLHNPKLIMSLQIKIIDFCKYKMFLSNIEDILKSKLHPTERNELLNQWLLFADATLRCICFLLLHKCQLIVEKHEHNVESDAEKLVKARQRNLTFQMHFCL